MSAWALKRLREMKYGYHGKKKLKKKVVVVEREIIVVATEMFQKEDMQFISSHWQINLIILMK